MSSHGAAGGRPTHSSPDDDAMLFRRLYPALRRFAAMCAPVSVEPDDLLQEAVAATLAVHPLSELDNPLAYLQTAIANRAKNAVKRNRRTRMDDTAVGASDAYPSDLSDLSRLSVHERAAVFLIDVERYPASEAAEIMGCSVVAVRARAARGRRTLRRLLGATP